MNLKKIAKITLISTLLATAVYAPSQITATQVSANTSKSLSNKAWTKKLAHAGYVFKLSPDAANTNFWMANKIGGKLYSNKHVRRIAKKNLMYKIDQVHAIKNGCQIQIVSRDGQVKAWVNFLNGVTNTLASKRALTPLVKAELAVTSETNAKKQQAKMAAVTAAADKLTGKNKQIAQTSIKELNAWCNYNSFANLPTLLLGSYPK
ncbi:hypothetical protein OZY43_07780 [Lactobacillus sp. ESL0785]|uniref:hypothetical protein n=1 Tax=Lactobacillus sp. ESL0785 TaxID=2983232 RepID=UPI0023F7EEE0|nr:hypothetical protein [Lactobacillus sp. ESL0785]WEV70824.1 hypothetical protein OZY43_07780 [Lactobacillus sp. ESL0785]